MKPFHTGGAFVLNIGFIDSRIIAFSKTSLVVKYENISAPE
jgi:hypothetical protein